VSPRGFVLGIVAAAAVAAGVLTLYAVRLFTVVRPTEHLRAVAGNFETYRERFRRAPSFLTRDEVRTMRAMLNDAHLAKARELGVSGLDDMDDVRAALEKRQLVPLRENRFWRIRELKNSVAYVTPDTLRLLEDIGARFQQALEEEGLPVFRFTISSVLRTREQQKRMVRVNRNAARTMSSHEFGTAFDLLRTEFDYSAATPLLFRTLGDAPARDTFRKADLDALGMQYQSVLRTILGRTVIELQNEGRCYAIFERREPCFHITLAGGP